MRCLPAASQANPHATQTPSIIADYQPTGHCSIDGRQPHTFSAPGIWGSSIGFQSPPPARFETLCGDSINGAMDWDCRNVLLLLHIALYLIPRANAAIIECVT